MHKCLYTQYKLVCAPLLLKGNRDFWLVEHEEKQMAELSKVKSRNCLIRCLCSRINNKHNMLQLQMESVQQTVNEVKI